MTTPDSPDLPEQDASDILAAEYVLGTLPLAEREAAATRVRRDAHFAMAVARWETRLGSLNDAYDEAPAPDLMPKIEARLFGTAPQKAPFWKGWFAGAAAAATLGLAVLVIWPQSPAPFAPLTTLAAEGSALRYDVALRGDELRVARIDGAAAETGRVHELWLIVGDAAPVSLGLIEGDGVTLSVAGLAAGMVLAISLEPTGGSPTGAPTGPVLVTGVIDNI